MDWEDFTGIKKSYSSGEDDEEKRQQSQSEDQEQEAADGQAEAPLTKLEQSEFYEATTEDHAATAALFNVSVELQEGEEAEEDPLQEFNNVSKGSSTSTECNAEFRWECQDEEFLNEVKKEEEETEDDGEPNGRGNGNKRSSSIKSRNGTLWSTIKPPDLEAQELTIQSDLVAQGKGPAQSVDNPLAVWYLLIEEVILTEVVQSLNKEMRKHRTHTGEQHLQTQRPTDVIEFRAWLGLNYLCGIFRNASQPENNGPLEELWSLELGNAVFRAVMSFKRYQFLAECLAFLEGSLDNDDDEDEKPKRKRKKKSRDPGEADLSQTLFNMWEKIVINFRSYYSPSAYCVLDEHLMETLDDRCPWLTAGMGLRVLTLTDAKTLYIANALVTKPKVQAELEVMHLISDIKGSQRALILKRDTHTLGNVMNQLLQHQLTSVGPLNAKSDLMPKLTNANSRKTQRLYADAMMLLRNTAQCDFDEEQEASYLISCGCSQRLKPMEMYKATEDAGERAHASSQLYTSRMATPVAQQESWQLDFLHLALDYTAHNAWVLYRLSKGEISQRDFLRQLGLFLTQQQLKRRLARRDRIPLSQRIQICEILGESLESVLSEASKMNVGAGILPADQVTLPTDIVLHPKFAEKRGRCRKCKGRNNPKTRSRCQQCLRTLCYRHLVVRCDDCSGVKNLVAETAPPPPTF